MQIMVLETTFDYVTITSVSLQRVCITDWKLMLTALPFFGAKPFLTAAFPVFPCLSWKLIPNVKFWQTIVQTGEAVQGRVCARLWTSALLTKSGKCVKLLSTAEVTWALFVPTPSSDAGGANSCAPLRYFCIREITPNGGAQSKWFLWRFELSMPCAAQGRAQTKGNRHIFRFWVYPDTLSLQLNFILSVSDREVWISKGFHAYSCCKGRSVIAYEF